MGPGIVRVKRQPVAEPARDRRLQPVIVRYALRRNARNALEPGVRTEHRIVRSQLVLRHLVEGSEKGKIRSTASYVRQLEHHISGYLALNAQVPGFQHWNVLLVLGEADRLAVVGFRRGRSAPVQRVDAGSLRPLVIRVSVRRQNHDRLNVVGRIGLIAAACESVAQTVARVRIDIPGIAVKAEPTAYSSLVA